MATTREGSQGVLIVVDVQVAVMRETWQASRIIENVALAVKKAREQHVPIVWVQHSDEQLVHGSPEWDWVAELSPAEDEPRLDKHFNSCFEETSLEETLASLGATHILLAGAATNWCIRATAYGALERGYDLTLISDAHTTETMKLDNGIIIEAAHLIDDLNIAMTWLTYPGRTNLALAVEQIDFTILSGMPVRER